MTEPTRRFFLGGMISALVVATVAPRLDAKGRILAGNTPVIYGNGVKDDSAGMAALMRGDPVIFGSDKIGIDEYGSVIIHDGRYLINNPVEVSGPGDLKITQAKFIAGLSLPRNVPLFRVHRDYVKEFTSPISTRILFGNAYRPDRTVDNTRTLWIEELSAIDADNWDPRPGPRHAGEIIGGEVLV